MARTVAERPLIRCAIYTRQSVAREIDLTSCEVQRERCEAFVGSMQYEGWICLAERFDDVGVSGGSLDRPGLRRLVKAIAAGQVDHVVVHRFDRLTRSLRDWVVLREPSRRSLLPLEQDPYLLRHVLLCGRCSGPMTTSASQAVTIENADDVPRYYRCRGSSHGPACRPTAQVAAREVEQEVLRQLQAPGSIRDLSPNARCFLENAIAENPEPLKPLPDKVLRKSRGRKDSRSKGSTRK